MMNLAAAALLSTLFAGNAAPPAGAPPASSQRAPDDAAPEAVPPPAPPVIDLAKLRAEYDKLRDELFRAHARAALVEQAVYNSRLGASLRWKGAPDFVLHRAEIRLDGTVIWDSGEKPLVDDLIKVSERPVKPGPHSVTVRIEVRPGKKGEREHADLGYESEQTFVVNVPDGKTTTVTFTGDDDGDLPEYEPELQMELKSEK